MLSWQLLSLEVHQAACQLPSQRKQLDINDFSRRPSTRHSENPHPAADIGELLSPEDNALEELVGFAETPDAELVRASKAAGRV